ncbi:hypothetical protein SMD11_1278 [Streptomyces albireticuli]|uniref:Uncharacterized protein n=2 Tax=Streptomyces albireticuli TaxID=1940 RepID=A0A1Z2KY32_9ACTN|nr:hypothetical protein SMD11_1278 [Streptomyces albireticuli]
MTVTRHITSLNMTGFPVGKRVRVKLPYCQYTGREAGIYRGSIQYIKGDHIGIWVPIKGHGAADGFLTGAARIDYNGVWIEGR